MEGMYILFCLIFRKAVPLFIRVLRNALTRMKGILFILLRLIIIIVVVIDASNIKRLAVVGVFTNREFKNYDATIAKSSLKIASSNWSIFFVIISVCVTFES